MLQPYDDRTGAAVQFINAVHPGLDVQTSALKDPKVVDPMHLLQMSS